MAKITFEILTALRHTAERLEKTTEYQWGHMGSCNCGFLAQEISQLRKDQIHARAMERSGDWTEQLNDYCPHSGFLMDDLIAEMIAFGFDIDDLKHLERLTDASILRTLAPETHLQHNIKGHVIQYLYAWAELIEEKLLSHIHISTLENQAERVSG